MRCGAPERLCVWAVYVFFTMVWVIFVRVVVRSFDGNQTAPILIGLVPPLLFGICAVSFRRYRDGVRRTINNRNATNNNTNTSSLTTISGTRVHDASSSSSAMQLNSVIVDTPPPKYEEVVGIRIVPGSSENVYFSNYQPPSLIMQPLSAELEFNQQHHHVRWSIAPTNNGAVDAAGNGLDNGLRARTNGSPVDGDSNSNNRGIASTTTVSGVENERDHNGHRLDQMAGSLNQTDTTMAMGNGDEGAIGSFSEMKRNDSSNCLPSYEEAVKRMNQSSVT